MRRAAVSGAALWRTHLFGGPLTGAVTLLLALALASLLWPLVRWAVIDATWQGARREDCVGGGACWVFIKARFGQFMYGFYPPDQRWRPDLWLVMLAMGLAAVVFAPAQFKRRAALACALIAPPLGIWLVGGGFGLRLVESRDWGGLMLTLFIALYSGLIAIPLGILLALGRRSRLPLIRMLSVIFIEFWRGVPIIAVIFLASLLLPLIMPAGVGIDRLARAIIGLGLVIAAYMAEAVRGGMQAVPEGQQEAATALGLSYWRTTSLIILPQALRIALPAMTNEFIALVKNTTLVLVVSILDLLGVAQASLADPSWIGLSLEAYAFSGTIYWLMCWALSALGRRLEMRLGRSLER